MRIWHQSWIVMEEMPAYKASLEAHARRVARPDTEVVVHGLRPGSFSTPYPGDELKYLGVQWMHLRQIVEGALRAQDEGYDAFALNPIFDPGLQEIRSLVDMPVAAYGESSMLMACHLGKRFALLCFIRETAGKIQENIRSYGLADRSVGVVPVEVKFTELSEAYGGSKDLVLEQVEAACRRAIALGADVIIPGEGPMMEHVVSKGLTRVDEAPVIDPFAAMIRTAELMVDMKRTCGLSVARRGFGFAAPPADMLKRARELYGF